MSTNGSQAIGGQGPVVAMVMEKLPVGESHGSTASGRSVVVECKQVSMAKVQSTLRTDAALTVEEDSGPPRDVRAASEPDTPVDPVSIIRAAATLDLTMALASGR